VRPVPPPSHSPSRRSPRGAQESRLVSKGCGTKGLAGARTQQNPWS
jgi:hypothetical protein